jgi:hypothetical protein
MRWLVNPPTEPQWHSWFAWYPVVIGDQKVWLEFVERKGEEHAAYDSSWIQYEYKFPDPLDCYF